jgi:SAM-dependent methyltransferase
VGCAQGRSTFRVNAPDLTVIGFDVSKQLVRQAIERARGRRSMSFFVADATRMPIVDASIDYVLIYGVLHHLPKPDRICGEAGRVLKVGGALFCSENNDSIFHPIFDWLQRISPIWYEEAGEHSHIQTEELQAWLEHAGFRPRVWSGVFVPPHLVNLLPPRVGRGLVAITDRAFGSIPWLCDQGGLIFSTSIKSAR